MPSRPEPFQRDALQRLLDHALRRAGRTARPVAARAENALVELASRPGLSRLVGWLADRRLPRPVLRRVVDAFVRLQHVDLAEAEVPPGGFPSFDAFFTRRLRAGSRPVDPSPEALVAPADGRVEALGPLPGDDRLGPVKGEPSSLADLLGDPDDAARFRGGQHAIVYLAPRDYHRVHQPADGSIAWWRHVPGRRYPVNPLGVRRVPALYARNERIVVAVEAPGIGPLRVVLVGTANVGRIELAFDDRGPMTRPTRTPAGPTAGTVRRPEQPMPVQRGEELGAFHLGSTVIVLLPPEAPLDAAAVLEGEHVRVGRALWHARR